MRDEVPAAEPARPEVDEESSVSEAESSPAVSEPAEGVVSPETDSDPEPGSWVGV